MERALLFDIPSRMIALSFIRCDSFVCEVSMFWRIICSEGGDQGNEAVQSRYEEETTLVRQKTWFYTIPQAL